MELYKKKVLKTINCANIHQDTKPQLLLQVLKTLANSLMIFETLIE